MTRQTHLGHLLIVTPSFLPEVLGGAERQCSILAPALARLGWRVTVLTPTTASDLPVTEECDGYRIERIRTRHFPSNGGRQFASLFSWTRSVHEWIEKRRDEIDVIYVFHARLHATPAVLAAHRWKLPLAVKLGRGGATFDFISLREKKFFYGTWVRRLLAATTRAYVANSLEIVDDLRTWGAPEKKIVFLPNGVGLPSEEKLSAANDVRDRAGFLYAGRLSKEKNLDVLITAFVGAATSAARLRIAGAGPEEKRLAELAVSLASEKITFLGSLDTMEEAYFASSFFVSASDAEGQSNALLEAMAHGLVPVICAASGAGDLVEDGRTGFVAAQPTVVAMQEALSRAMALSPEDLMRMSERARGVVATRFGIDAVAAKTSAVLSRITHGEAGAERIAG